MMLSWSGGPDIFAQSPDVSLKLSLLSACNDPEFFSALFVDAICICQPASTPGNAAPVGDV
jgi:hypothetical protein